jgi:membrane peptidoglycan carboxypeptidase
MALVLDRHLSKDQQLQLYVSTVYLGRHDRKAVFGLVDAANVYFYKNPSDLSTEEFVTLVAMIKSPNLHHPVSGAERLELRVSRITSVLAGTCEPSGWFDTEYVHCKSE